MHNARAMHKGYCADIGHAGLSASSVKMRESMFVDHRRTRRVFVKYNNRLSKCINVHYQCDVETKAGRE